MNIERTLDRWSRPAPWSAVVSSGLAALVILQALVVWVRATAERRIIEAEAVAASLEESWQAVAENQSLRDLRGADLARLKRDLAKLTQSRRALYEGGLQIQEEYRLLQKQWEITTTYLLIDPDGRKIHLMRGEQALETYPIGYEPRAFGADAKAPAGLSAIVSKERFAHPERGKSETVNGQLQWEPPQVGTSLRANALGEYVMFTSGSLILHGPPKKPAEHSAFPHYCIGLPLATARRLYAMSYIGTKIKVLSAAGAVTAGARSSQAVRDASAKR